MDSKFDDDESNNFEARLCASIFEVFIDEAETQFDVKTEFLEELGYSDAI